MCALGQCLKLGFDSERLLRGHCAVVNLKMIVFQLIPVLSTSLDLTAIHMEEEVQKWFQPSGTLAARCLNFIWRGEIRPTTKAFVCHR